MVESLMKRNSSSNSAVAQLIKKHSVLNSPTLVFNMPIIYLSKMVNSKFFFILSFFIVFPYLYFLLVEQSVLSYNIGTLCLLKK